MFLQLAGFAGHFRSMAQKVSFPLGDLVEMDLILLNKLACCELLTEGFKTSHSLLECGRSVREDIVLWGTK